MLVLPCVLRLICTDSISLTQIRNPVKDSRGLAQILSASFRLNHSDSSKLWSRSDLHNRIQNHPASARSKTSSDLLDLDQIHEILDSCCFSELIRFMRFHSDSISRSQIHLESLSFDGTHSAQLRFTQSNLLESKNPDIFQESDS